MSYTHNVDVGVKVGCEHCDPAHSKLQSRICNKHHRIKIEKESSMHVSHT